MNSNRRSIVALALTSMPLIAHAQSGQKPAAGPTASDMEILKQKVKADKKLLVAANMQLSEAEAKAFWPLYDEYQKGLAAVNQRLGKAIKAYADAYKKGSLPNDVARQLAGEAIGADEDENKLKRALLPKLESAVGGMKAVRYLQIENKIRAVIKLELASEIPLVY